MSDHWKSLADQLGAPSIDDSESESAAEQQPEPSPQDSAMQAKGSDAAKERSDASQSAEGSQPGLSGSVEREASSPEGRFDELKVDPSDLELSWTRREDRRKDKRRDDASRGSTSAGEVSSEQPAGRRESSEDPEQPQVIAALGAGKPDKPQESPRSESKGKKRKSMWGNLTERLAGKRPEDDERTAEGVEPSSERSEDTDDLPIFGAAEAEANPALEQLFADAPREGIDAWNKPKRVVDDIGWEDEESKGPSFPSDEASSRGGAPASSSVGGEADDDDMESSLSFKSHDSDEEDAEARRGRNRRRRGRRGRDRDSDASERESREPSAEDISTDWGADTDTSDSDDEGGEGLAERRSNRRRRRGGRRRGASEEETAQGTPDDARRTRHERDSEQEPSDFAEPLDRAEDDEAGDDEDASDRRRGRRRRRRGKPSDSPRSQPSVKKEAEYVDDEEDGDSGVVTANFEEDETSQVKHKNIPTWQQALEPLVEGNLDNHKRNEGRGNYRGRSRSRR